jgi:tetratricopeptide (TPR) repeat protein
LLHYPTNETLSATFIAGTLCIALHLLRAARPWRGWYAVLGIALGLALSTKSTAVLVMAMVMSALALKLILRRERAVKVWLGVIGAPLLIALLLGCWHYLRMWRDFGNPLAGAWDPKMLEPWWQARGFQTSHYYLSFGDSLSRPYFSGLHSFWDALYSSLWGDGLLGGSADYWVRPPWNYDFMTAGFALALVPTVIVLTGLVRALAMCFRAPSPAWLLLLGLGWILAFAILDMSLKMPTYGHVKAFFGLPVLLPFCALAALGFEYWLGRGKTVRFVAGAAVGVWLINLYASFWIRPHALPNELSRAISRYLYLKEDASADFSAILRDYPNDSKATLWLASLEAKKRPEEAVKLLERGFLKTPGDGQLESELARDLALCDRIDEAAAHARHAVMLGPEDEGACQLWCTLALRDKKYDEAVTAGRAALSLDPSALPAQFNLGVALMNLRQIPEATSHFAALVKAQSGWAEAHYCLGRCLLGQPGKRDEAIAHLQEAVRLDPAHPEWNTALQNALKGQ